ncbi:MAG: PEP-CTERM sorting domain-containing protein [Myxococcota bacterium]
MRCASSIRTVVASAALLLATGLGAGSASATLVVPEPAEGLEAFASTFTGKPLEVSLVIDEKSAPGDLVFTLSVIGPGSTVADLRGFFLNVTDESLLPGLTITGPNVTGSKFTANGVTGVGYGNNLLGGGSPCPCDLGIELGTPGIGKDDLRTVTFTLSHATKALDLTLVSGQTFGVRATSVGEGRCRDGSSKLSGVIPVVPEPGTALLMGLGLVGLASVGPRRAA